MRFPALFFILFSTFGFSQSNDKVVDSLFREDQMYFSISYNFLQNKPDNFSQYSFSAGLTTGLLRDFPISKNRHWSIAPGIGYSYSDLKQNIDFLSVSPSASDVIVRSRLTLHYLELPLEIRWRNATPESHKFFCTGHRRLFDRECWASPRAAFLTNARTGSKPVRRAPCAGA